MSELEMLPSSQGSMMEMPSSPIAGPPAANKSSKPRKPPSITPRRFTRFFSPMNTRSGSGTNSKSKSSRRLKDITKNAVNQDQPHAPPTFHGFQDINFETPRKKRKILPTPESSPVQPLDSSPLRPSNYTPPRQIAYHDVDSLLEDSEVEEEVSEEVELYSNTKKSSKISCHPSYILYLEFNVMIRKLPSGSSTRLPST